MPWQEKTTVGLREEFCVLASQDGANVSELSRRYGISRATGHTWLARYRAAGGAGLADRSRRPHGSPGRTSAEVEARVLAPRDAQPTWGGRKLRRRLLDLGSAPVPAASTITAILHRHARIDPAETVRHAPWARFQAAAPNDLWQLAFKGHFALAHGRCHPLHVLDDHSRFVLGMVACPNEQTAAVRATLTAIFRRYGLPWRRLCANGPPWGTIPAESRLTERGAWLVRLGIALTHGRPAHPQTQGKLERCNRTLGADGLAIARYPDLAAAQTAFDAWRTVYNQERPHEALPLATPRSRYQPSPRPFPETLAPITYEPGDLIRKVQRHGHIDFHGQTLYISQAIIGQPVALRATTIDGLWEVFFCHQRLRHIDLRTPPAA